MSGVSEAGIVQPGASRLKRRWSALNTMSARRIMLGYALVTPLVLWRLATSIYPFLYTVYLSFFDNSPVRRSFDYIGLQNYVTLVNDRNVQDTLGFTIYFTVLSVSLQVVLALAISQLLNRRFLFRNMARAINLLPWAMAGIVAGTAARWVFNQDYGLVNDLIWRVTGERPLWLVDVDRARFAVTITDVWKNTSFLTVIFIGGLQGISPELYEAAKIDGSDGVRSFWYITLPLLMPLVISMTIFVAVYRVLTFEIVYALTQGGPGNATSLMSYYVYLKAFRVLDFGYSAALSMALFFMVLLLGLFGFGLLRRAWARL